MHSRPGGWRPWLVTFAILFTMAGAWSLASPLFSLPDEPVHTIKAAAVARGQLSGREVVEGQGSTSFMRVPQLYELSHGIPDCYEQKSNVTADCAPAFTGSEREAEIFTAAGRYPPLYYAAVGLPSLVDQSAVGVRLMRLGSAALCAALLASAFACAGEAQRLRALVLGLAVAVTPMVIYLSGGINPSGLEIAAATALWASLGSLLICADEVVVAPLARRAAVAAALLAASRPASLLMMALVVVVVIAALVDRARLRRLVSSRGVRSWGTLAATSVLLSLFWVLDKSALNGFFGTPAPPDFSNLDVVRVSIGNTGVNLRQMIGGFGALETLAPLLTHVVWLFAVGLLVLLTFATASARARWAMAGLLTLVVVLPIVFESSQARVIGFAWQGRYTLPLAVGVPIMAALALGRTLDDLGRALPRMLFTLVAVGHVLAFVWVLRRFAVGDDGLVTPIRWQPPFTAPVLVTVFVLANGAYALWLRRLWSVPEPPSLHLDSLERHDSLAEPLGAGDRHQ